MIIAAPRRTMPKKISSSLGPWKYDIEAETVAIKRQRYGDILYDEEWCNAGDFWFSHVNFPF
jgi:hypothetical protein